MDITQAIAGSIGGATAFSIVYPLQTITSRLQVQSSKSGLTKYKGTIHAFKTILHDEGIKGLYGGLGMGFAGVTTAQFVYYYFYSFLRRKLGVDTTKVTVLQSMLTTAGAGIINVLVTSPLWMVNTRQKVSLKTKDGSSSTWTVAKQIYSEGGILKFWEGIMASLILVSNPIIQYGIFAQMKKYVLIAKNKSSMFPTKVLTRKEIVVLSTIAKAFSMIVTFPYILAKSRLQVQHTQREEENDGPIKPYTGLLDCLFRVFKEEGINGLYKGFQSKMMSSILQAILLFLVHNEVLGLAKWIINSGKAIPEIN